MSPRNRITSQQRELFQVIGAGCGIFAAIGVFIMYFATRSALSTMANQTVEQIKAIPGAKPAAVNINVPFSPLGTFAPIFSKDGLVVVLIIVVIVLIVKLRRQLATR